MSLAPPGPVHRAAPTAWVAIGLGIVAAFCLGTGCVVHTPTPDLAGQDVSFTVVHTSDLHSRFFPYFFAPGAIDKGLGLVPPSGRDTAVVGGIARVSTIAQCIRGRMSGPACDKIADLTGPPAVRSLHLDSGDIFEGAPVFNVFAGEVETRGMSQLGLTAMVIGNHEFDKGSVNAFTQFQRFAGFQLLAANYDFGDPTDPALTKFAFKVPPYLVANIGGLKVGVIGMSNLSSIQGIIEGGNSLGVRPIETKQALSTAAEALRSQVDVLMVVSHLGLDEDENVSAADAETRDQNQEIAIAGVDVIFGGHLHIVLNPPKDLLRTDSETGMEVGRTVLCHSGAFAKYVGRLDLVVHVPTEDEKAQGQHGSVKSYAYTLIPVSDAIPDDPDMVDLLEPYQLKMNTFLNLTQTYAVIPCPPDVATCPKIQRTNPEGGDSQLGNLVATAMRLRERVEADFGLTNSLGIRADFESGPLNLEQMYNVFPFENTIATMFLSGVEVQDMLDFVAARSSERGCKGQSQVSGIYFDMQCASDDPECAQRRGFPGPCAKNIVLGDSCRLPDGTLDTQKCRPLNPFAEYRVAVNDYIANGGSGFAVLKRNTTKFNTGISLRDALVDYIRTLPSRCDPSQYTNIVGVHCRDAHGVVTDCTADCGCHDADSGMVAFGKNCDKFVACAGQLRSPEPFDYSTIACLNNQQQATDGRIRALTTSGGN